MVARIVKPKGVLEMSRPQFGRIYSRLERHQKEPFKQIESKNQKMKKYLSAAAVAALMTVWAGTSSAQSNAPYTEGGVWAITMIHTKPGMTDDYLKGLAKSLKTILAEEKKQGLIMDSKVLLGEASTPGDYNILTMVEFKNMAALDGFREKTDPIATKAIGGEDQQRQMAVKRLEIREIMGNKLMREITLN
jgi:hypothetical protein